MQITTRDIETIPNTNVDRDRITLIRALTLASSLYAKHLTPLLSMYLLVMSIPVILQTYLLATYVPPHSGNTDTSGDAITALVLTIPASDPHYFAWAFAKMFGDLITPFALASLIVAIKHLIQFEKSKPLSCIALLGRKWLTIAQFGLMMHIVWYAGSEGAKMIGGLHGLTDTVFYLILFLMLIAFAVVNFGYTSALVVVTLDRVDPIRGILFGMWFGLRHLLSSLGRLILLTTLAIAGLCLYALAIDSTHVALTFAFICAYTVFSSWVYFAMVLFVLDRIPSETYANVPRWMRIRT